MESTTKASSSAGAARERRQVEAWLPYLLVKLNQVRTKELIPEFATLSPQEKVEKAIGFFERVIAQEPDDGMKPSRQWSLEYYQACAQGAAGRRQFLVEEGVFEGGERLKRPSRVRPRMEIVNLNPLDYGEPLQGEAAEMTLLMFHEYFGVKNLLSFPELADVIASLSSGISSLRRVSLPQPRLKLSLLLRDYVQRILQEAKGADGPPLVAIFGPGKGEELVPLMAVRLSVLLFDAHDPAVLKGLLASTFDQAGVPAPEMVLIGEGSNADGSPLESWEREGHPPTIFICSDVDFSQDGAIPEQLQGASRVAAAIYVLHEMDRKEALFPNMAAASRGSVVVFDGCPSSAALDNIILPVSDRSGALITGHDAVISHILSLPPEEMQRIAERSAPQLGWESMMVGPPMPAPLFHKLQGAVVGRHA